MTTPRAASGSATAVIVAMAAIVCFTIAGVVVIAVAVPDGGNAGSLIAILVATLAPTLASIANVAKTAAVGAQVEAVAADTNAIRNGEMEGKLHNVLDDRQRARAGLE